VKASLKRNGRRYGCPVELTLDLLGGKWKTVILARLKQTPLRYAELRRAVPGLADKMLTQRLRDLESVGFVERSKYSDGQSRYSLTPLGLSLGPALEALYAWGWQVSPAVGARFEPQAAASRYRTTVVGRR
jgi:DNA-binding HxlR family transcriptional regulator